MSEARGEEQRQGDAQLGGADETLTAYFSYFLCHWRALCKTDRTLARSEIEAYTRTHGGDVGDLYRSALRQACRSQLWHFPGYGRLAGLRRRHGLRKTRWFTDDIRDAAPSEHTGLAHRTPDSSVRWSSEHPPLRQYLRVDDRTDGSVGRYDPFLDYRLVSLAFQLPAEWKLRGPWNKYVLREALRGHIPDSVRLRPDKMGFPAPIRQWVRGPLYAKLQDLLASREVRERGLYPVEAIRQDLDRHRTGEIDVSNGLLAIAQVEHWLKQQEHSRQRDHAAAGRGR
jgi:asparagine synthase (glutamine-hydrolysing)